MPELAALVESVGQLNRKLEINQTTLVAIEAQLDRLPEEYVPRTEAQKKAAQVRRWLAGLLAGGLFVAGGAISTGFVLKSVNEKFNERCIDNRTTIRDLINTAVADRQPLPTSTPDTIAAIERINAEFTRPLRERLLSLEGAHPEKC